MSATLSPRTETSQAEAVTRARSLPARVGVGIPPTLPLPHVGVAPGAGVHADAKPGELLHDRPPDAIGSSRDD